MLKLSWYLVILPCFYQPPSGGCVLKHFHLIVNTRVDIPAAFGRLCVETHPRPQRPPPILPAAFGRLCVETDAETSHLFASAPAAFGRLCVETRRRRISHISVRNQPPSGGCVLKHLSCGEADGVTRPAAFGRLCVETLSISATHAYLPQPPSGGCVLKLFGSSAPLFWNFASRLRAAVC